MRDAARRLKRLRAHATLPGNDVESAPERVPVIGENRHLLHTRWAYDHIRWMVKKDRIGQDMYLLGIHGPIRRWLALRFCELLNRECEYVALTRDTTEADLKQRREIVAGGNVEWSDQGVVRAALHGRVLILEGLEKVERNILPLLNNLLENREMALEAAAAAARHTTACARAHSPRSRGRTAAS